MTNSSVSRSAVPVLVRLLVFLALGPAVGATVVLPAEFREIVADATLIVRGRVTEVRPVAVRGRGVESVGTVAVDAVLKGEAGAFVSVRVPGGTVGRYRFVMVGAPVLRPDETAVFFLKRGTDAGWRPVGLSAGIARVDVDPSSRRPVVRAPILLGTTASVGPLVRGDRRRGPLAVGDFDALVRLVVEDQRAAATRVTQ